MTVDTSKDQQKEGKKQLPVTPYLFIISSFLDLTLQLP